MFTALPLLLSLLHAPSASAETGGPRARSTEIGWARPVGLGGVLGAPSGLSAKVYLDRRARYAVDSALVVHGVGGGGGVMAQGALHWHPGTLLQTPVAELPWRVGGGAYVGDTGYRYTPRFGAGLPTPEAGPAFAGVRGVVGVDADFVDGPLQVFADLSTQLTVTPRAWWGVGAAVGARYYF